MTVIAVPNVSEGRDAAKVEELGATISRGGAGVLDVHTDAIHNRSVFTVSGAEECVVEAMAQLGAAARHIDLDRHVGVHPRLGVLDVCPIVAHDIELADAAVIARATGRAIGERAGLPVYLYGAAAMRAATRELPEIRRGGLRALMRRAEAGLAPDFGPQRIDTRAGVVCVGARGVLIAFNVWLACDGAIARDIASQTRTRGGGPPGVRALGFALGPGHGSQVSMNLIDPAHTGIDRAFAHVATAAARRGVKIVATEIVGLVPESFRPQPGKEAARLLVKPGRSLESALSAS
ncbi:MAG: glutamate formimidoyltransferase [Actinomycetota bacterium]